MNAKSPLKVKREIMKYDLSFWEWVCVSVWISIHHVFRHCLIDFSARSLCAIKHIDTMVDVEPNAIGG